MNLNQYFEQGLTKEGYEATLDKHKEGYFTIYESFKLPNDETFFKQAKEKNLRILVIAEPWCGHCLLNIPLIVKLARQAQIDIRFALRDENTELIDAYLTNGNRVIPIVIFLDEAGNELGKWGPVAEATKEIVDPLRKQLPEKDSPEYEQAFRSFADTLSEQFTKNEELWQDIYKEMKQTIEQCTK